MKLSIKRNRSAVIALACGVFCAVCVALYVSQVDERAHAAQDEMLARYGGDQVEVCVARRDIAAGQTITDSDLETKMWIATLLPADAITSKADAVGQQVGSSILAGEVVSSARFGFESSSIEVPEGMVALSVPARAVQAVGGALGPGMNVDVYAVGASSTTRIASSVKVLETCAEAASGSSTWITLALPPQKVPEMVSAAENTELYFVLPSESAAELNSEEQKQETKLSSGAISASSSSSSASSSSASSAASARESSASATSSSSAASSSSKSSSSGSSSASSAAKKNGGA